MGENGQAPCVSETTENSRRWNGYVCPDCRFVFRVPRDHDGRGIICPSCRRMLKVPAAGEVTPSLVGKKIEKVVPVSLPESFQRAQEKASAGTVAATGGGGEMRQRSRHRHEEEQLDWDTVQTERLIRVSKRKKSRIGIWLASGAFVLGLMSAVIFLARREKTEVEPIAIAPVVAPVEIKESVPDPIELPQEMNRSEAELVKELEPLAKGFLEAETVDALLPFVRDSARLTEKIRNYYPDNKVPAPGMGAFNTHGTLAYRGQLASLSIRTKDFEEKQIAFLRTEDGMKIDWESFVAWSEMPWKQFIAERPTQPVLFRASLKMLDYYNFEFSDEKKWQSYELRSPDGENVLYGYVKRDSALDGKLRPFDLKTTKLVTVKLKFPPNDSAKNQVIIDDMVMDGWVEGAVD